MWGCECHIYLCMEEITEEAHKIAGWVWKGEAGVPLFRSTVSLRRLQTHSGSRKLDLNSFHSLRRLLSGQILKTTTRQAAAHVLIRIFQRQVYWWNKWPGSSKARAAGRQGFHSLRSDSWQALALRSMAEAHLEMDDGSTLLLIRICHTADGDRVLHADSYRLQRGADPSGQSPCCLRVCQCPGEMKKRGAGPLRQGKMARKRGKRALGWRWCLQK